MVRLVRSLANRTFQLSHGHPARVAAGPDVRQVDAQPREQIADGVPLDFFQRLEVRAARLEIHNLLTRGKGVLFLKFLPTDLPDAKEYRRSTNAESCKCIWFNPHV